MRGREGHFTLARCRTPPVCSLSGIFWNSTKQKPEQGGLVAGEGSARQPGDIQEEEPSGVQAQEEQVLS